MKRSDFLRPFNFKNLNIRNIRKKLLKTWQYFHDTRLRYGPKECNIPEKKLYYEQFSVGKLKMAIFRRVGDFHQITWHNSEQRLVLYNLKIPAQSYNENIRFNVLNVELHYLFKDSNENTRKMSEICSFFPRLNIYT